MTALARARNLGDDSPMANDLDRFVKAQDSVYSDVIEELGAGKKTSHWMWFIFPQLAGLGRSDTARYYSIKSSEEAVAYLQHPILGARLRECTSLVNRVEGSTLEGIFGSIDAIKFRSSMTLFAHVAEDNAVFREALEKFCGGEGDETTMALLGKESSR